MDTPILNKLRQHLASITPEQFQKEWDEIEAMGFSGPSIEDFLKSIRLTPTISEINILETFGTQISEEFIASPGGHTTYVMAA
jgi:hypothetical protein